MQSAAKTEPSATARDVEALAPWFHNLHLPDGTQTAPQHWLGDFPRYKWEALAPHLPADLTGWRALDIGCNAGYYSFELARRGARVLAMDCDPHYLRQARWAAERYGLAERVEFREMQVYDLAREPERFDLVLFLGVFYHLRYPFLGLDTVARKVQRLLVFQTLTMPEHGAAAVPEDLLWEERSQLAAPGWPKMAFIEHAFQADPTNWWAPNPAAIEAMLRASGLRVTGRPGHELYICEPNPDFNPDTAELDEAQYRAVYGLSGAPTDHRSGPAGTR